MMTGYHVGARAHRAARHHHHRAPRLALDVRRRGDARAGARARDGGAGCPSRRRSWASRAGLADRRPRAARPARATPSARCSTTVSAGPTIAFWVTSFMGLLLVYGLNTWLPQIMRAAGLRAGRGAGAAAGAQRRRRDRAAGRRPGGRPDRQHAAPPSPGSCARRCSSPLLSIKLPGVGGLRQRAAGRHLRVQRAGAGLRLHRPRLPGVARGTAMGTASGVGPPGAISGPLIGGCSARCRPGLPWGFYTFAAVAAIGAVCDRPGEPRPRPRRATAAHRGRGEPASRAPPLTVGRRQEHDGSGRDVRRASAGSA